MILPAGLAIRFKGNQSDHYATAFADSLPGHCARNGSKLVITKTTRIRVKMYPDGVGDGSPSSRPAVLDLNAHRSNHE